MGHPYPTLGHTNHRRRAGDKIGRDRARGTSRPFSTPMDARRTDAMADILYVAVTVAFFALAVGFVRVCDHIIGPDPTPANDVDDRARPIDVDTDPVAAGAVK